MPSKSHLLYVFGPDCQFVDQEATLQMLTERFDHSVILGDGSKASSVQDTDFFSQLRELTNKAEDDDHVMICIYAHGNIREHPEEGMVHTINLGGILPSSQNEKVNYKTSRLLKEMGEILKQAPTQFSSSLIIESCHVGLLHHKKHLEQSALNALPENSVSGYDMEPGS